MKQAHPLFIALLVWLFIGESFFVYGRTYETLKGVKIEGTFVDLKSSSANKAVVIKLDKTGKLFELPLARFSPSDQHYIKFAHLTKRAKGTTPQGTTKVTQTDTIPLPPPSGNSVFSNLGSKLVGVEGRSVRSRKMQSTPDYYAFYFAASWCPACTQFTPRFAEYYKNNISFAKPKVEIIFISRDNDKKSMENYMLKGNMPWPALRYTDPKREQLIEKYGGNGTPCLVLVDRSGKVISDSYVNGKNRGAFAVKQDLAAWFTGGERMSGSIIKSNPTPGKRVSDR